MTRRGLSAAVAVAITSGSATVAAVEIPTVYDNMHMFAVGSRAAGMGGAYTALSCDEAALHYNPAALGCAGSSRLELAANVYMLQAMSVPDAFGEGQDIDAISYQGVPSIVGGVRVLRDPHDDTGSGRVVFGLNVEVPHSLALKVDPAQPERPNFLAVRVRDTITAGDIGVGWQINRFVALGLSLGAGLRTFEANFSTLLTDEVLAPCLAPEGCTSFVQETRDEEAIAVGGRAKLGVRITPSDALSIGLAVTSPTLDFWGTATIVSVPSVAVGDPATGGAFFSTFPARMKGDSDLSLPLRMALGVAYAWPRFVLSFDASLNFPHTARTAYNLEQTEIRGIVPLTDEELADEVLASDRTWQPNFNLGAEIGVVDDVVINLGGFTDFSSVSEFDVEEFGSDRVHMFGGTLGLGLLGKQARGWFGLSFEMGQAISKVVAGELNLSNVFVNGFALEDESTITRWTLAGFIGSNYSFVGDPDEDADEDDP